MSDAQEMQWARAAQKGAPDAFAALVERRLAHGHLYPDDGAFVREVQARLQPSSPKVVALPAGLSWRRRPWVRATAAAVVLTAALFWAFRSGPIAARLVGIESATWASGQVPPPTGDDLDAQRLRLATRPQSSGSPPPRRPKEFPKP
jgi:hypothetical protein